MTFVKVVSVSILNKPNSTIKSIIIGLVRNKTSLWDEETFFVDLSFVSKVDSIQMLLPRLSGMNIHVQNKKEFFDKIYSVRHLITPYGEKTISIPSELSSGV